MRIRFLIRVTVFLTPLIFMSCTEDHITNVTDLETTQGITGRIIPGEAGTVVAAWQGTEIGRTTTDTLGYFSLDNLPAGLYEIRITSPGGAQKVIPDVNVKSGVTTPMGSIRLSDPSWPLYSIYPADGDSSVQPIDALIRIYSHERLDVQSLAQAVVFTPEISGD